MFTTIYDRLTGSLRVHWLGIKGRFQYHRGRGLESLHPAFLTFQELVDLSPDNFVAHLYLGKIAAEDMLTQIALREFTLCYRLDPHRLRRSAIPNAFKDRILRREEFEGDSLLDRSSSRAGIPVTPGSSSRPPISIFPEIPWGEEEQAVSMGATQCLEGTDFASYEEYQRFEHLAPITAREIRDTDLDLMLSRLVGHG